MASYQLPAAASISLVLLICSGCATNIESRYYDPSDPCGSARLTVIQTAQSLSDNVVTNSAIGAVVGAGIGVVAGAAAGKAAVAGAAAGATLGGLLGAEVGELQNEHARDEALAAVNKKAAEDADTTNAITAAIRTLTASGLFNALN